MGPRWTELPEIQQLLCLLEAKKGTEESAWETLRLVRVKKERAEDLGERFLLAFWWLFLVYLLLCFFG